MFDKDFNENIGCVGSAIVLLAVLYLVLGIFWSFTAANIIFGILGALLIGGIIYIIILKIRAKHAEIEAAKQHSTEPMQSNLDSIVYTPYSTGDSSVSGQAEVETKVKQPISEAIQEAPDAVVSTSSSISNSFVPEIYEKAETVKETRPPMDEIKQESSIENTVTSSTNTPKRITCDSFPQYKYLAKIKGMTNARIEKCNILDGDPVTVEYSILDGSAKKRFVLKMDDINGNETIVGSIDDKSAEILFRWYSHETIICILHGEIVEREDKNGNSKYFVELSVPYDIDNEDFPFYTEIVGVEREDRQECLKHCYIPDAVLIEHSPTEECPEKTTVTHMATGKCLGHIRTDTAKSLIEIFGKGRSYYGIIATKNDKDGIINCDVQFISIVKSDKCEV